MKKISFVLAMTFASVSPAAFSFSGDAEAGKALSAKVCAACHGADGNSAIPINPSLAGQNYTYLVQALKDYRSGKRNNPIMNGQAAALKDDDINNLAAYYSRQKGKLVPLQP
jgi:cytochrome c553